MAVNLPRQPVLDKCPPIEQLLHFVLGNLTIPALDALSEHVAHCATCQASLDTLDATADSFVSRLRQASATKRPTADPLLDSLILGAGAAVFQETLGTKKPATLKSGQTAAVGRSAPIAGPSISDQLDCLCNAFEREWIAGRRPPIEDYLTQIAAAEVPQLLRELVGLDVEYRHKLAEVPSIVEYLARFPRYAAALRDVDFRRHDPEQDFDVDALPQASDETIGYPGADAQFLKQFELLEKVGRGGFGTVWRARDLRLDRMVAIKVPRKEELQPDELEQFFREARAAAQLRHPHIVRVYEVNDSPTTPYIVTDFIKGVSLKDWLSAKQMAPQAAAAFCATLARALQHAHEHGVIHRDIKPGNVIIDEDDAPHLTDFGLAKRDTGDESLFVKGDIVGTPTYMSPEQARGDATTAGPATDVYSLGVVLYELLAGNVPFRGKVPMILRQVLHDEPKLPSKTKRGIPRDLETICLKAMSKVPAQRYTTAADLATDLDHFLKANQLPLGEFR